MGVAGVAREPRRAWLFVLVPLVPLLVGICLFTASGRDDSYITYWAAHTLARDGQIFNYNGEHVEQSSSLAHVLLLAALHAVVPVAVPTLGWLTSIAFGIATVIAARRLAAEISPGLATGGALLVACSSQLAYWSFSGMETTLAAFFVTWFVGDVARCLRDGWRPSRLAGTCLMTLVYLLTRPEAFFVALAALLGAVGVSVASSKIGRGTPSEDGARTVRSCLALLATVLGSFLAIVAFRLLYFGDAFPQPVAGKMAGITLTAIGRGLGYLVDHAFSQFQILTWLLAAAGVILAALAGLRARGGLAVETTTALFLTAHVGFAVLAGGDWMEAGRFLVPVIPVAIILALRAVHRLAVPAAATAIVAVLAGLQLADAVDLAARRSTGSTIWSLPRPVVEDGAKEYSWIARANRVHARDIPLTMALDGIIREALQKKPRPITVLSGQAGMVAYYLALAHPGDLRFIDRYGLVTRDFTSCPVTASHRRRPVGVALGYDEIIERREALRERCGFELPDVIFDQQRPDGAWSNVLRRAGYTIVYGQWGDVQSGSRWFRGCRVEADFFVAVKDGLAVQRPFVSFGPARESPGALSPPSTPDGSSAAWRGLRDSMQSPIASP